MRPVCLFWRAAFLFQAPERRDAHASHPTRMGSPLEMPLAMRILPCVVHLGNVAPALHALRIGTVSLLIGALSVTLAFAQSSPTLPHLRKEGTATQLIVHNKPYLIIGGELGNSSASDTKYMEPVWSKLRAMELNTIEMPVYWELVEPREGKFDFALVDNLVDAARKSGLTIVILWFGSWKNSMSCYAPSWVKTDQARFPRARMKDGRALEILTPFSAGNRNADAKAFAALMKHLRTIDAAQNTVIMVQVENEIGMIPEARDYCAQAEQAFTQQVPESLTAYLRTEKDSISTSVRDAWNSSGRMSTGTWNQVFGSGSATDEIFMAWHFAEYTDFVAEAGKKEYPLPMYVNAALIRPNYKPGQYPSAGPLPHLMEVWRAAAPHIDFLAPDIYFTNFAEWLGKYDRAGNAVFIPEVDRRQSPANAFFAFGEHNAIGYDPFSIESADSMQIRHFRRAYDILHQLTPMILEHQGTGTMAGFLLDSATQTAEITLGKFTFTVKHEYSWPYAARIEGSVPRYGGLIIMTASNEFYVAGSGVVVTFRSTSTDGSIAGIESIEEGNVVDGRWIAGRRLNGDEDHQGRHLNLPGSTFVIQRVRLYTYK